LRRKQDAYEATGKSPSAIDLHRELNALKKTELPWMSAVSKCAPQEALCHLDHAFAHCSHSAGCRDEFLPFLVA
jgi:putative transposase